MRRPSFPLSLVRLLLVLLGGLAGAPAPRAALPGPVALTPAPSAATPATSPADLPGQLQARLVAARAELNLATVGPGLSTNLPPAATASEALEYRLALQALVRTYENHLDELTAIDAARQRQQDLDRAARAWTGFAEPPPWSILLVDELWDSIQSLSGAIEANESTRTILGHLAEEARSMLRDSDERLRHIDEQLEKPGAVAGEARQVWLRTLEQARNRSAAASVASLETRQRRLELDLAEHRQQLAFVRRQHAIAAQQVRFSADDLHRVLGGLELTRLQLQEERRATEAAAAARQKDLEEARDRLRLAIAGPNSPPGNPASDAGTASPTNAPSLARLEEIVRIRTIETETFTLHLRALGLLTDSVVAEEALWERRYATFDTDDLALLRESYRRLDRLSSLIQLGKPYFLQQIEVVARQIAEQEDRLRNQPVAPADSPSVRDVLDSYRQRDEYFRRAFSRFERTERLIRRWKEALDQRRLTLPIGSRLRDLFGELSSFAAKLWTFELFAVEDTITVDGQPITGRRAITVGKISLAILILVLGTLVARYAARWAERFSVRRFQVEPNQASLIRRWIMVVFVIGLVLFSLVSVRIPLTVFAFAGGALAIGVGFGTQNLLKNFISGIIILFERPFRVGDILDVAGRTGVVTGVGIRSSVLQLWDGTETLIPNSALLENNLTNWTYTSRSVRFSVAVGVAYGSDTRRVAQLLAETADRHGLVLTSPKPVVLFQNFGDSALLFELRYWVDVGTQNAAQIASDLRHMIAIAFGDHGISIAFPQRDVRLDATHPLRIEVQRHRPDAPTPPPATS